MPEASFRKRIIANTLEVASNRHGRLHASPVLATPATHFRDNKKSWTLCKVDIAEK